MTSNWTKPKGLPSQKSMNIKVLKADFLGPNFQIRIRKHELWTQMLKK